MYKYSPIKSMQIKNFRNLGDVSIDFSESPIISLIGENESGKTSVVKAFGVCAMHTDFRSQKDFIRDGTLGFGVAIELEDGTEIVRIKQTNGNRYYVSKDGQIIWDANKLESDVPKAVQDVMGLIEEPETKELLHIRTYEDQLLFVVTPASTNYKVMYDALKISQITKAIKAGSTEANGLKHDIGQAETSIATLSQSLSAIKTFDIEPLLNIRDKIQEQKSLLTKLDRIADLVTQRESMINELGNLRKLEESGITTIDIDQVKTWMSVDRVLKSIESIKSTESAYLELSHAESIDTGLLSKLNEALDKKTSIHEMSERSKNFVDLANLDTVSEVVVSSLLRACNVGNEISKSKEMLSVYDTSDAESIGNSSIEAISSMDKVISLISSIEANQATVKQIDTYVDQVLNWMKSVGVATASCPKCGETVVIDIDKIK